MNARGGRGLGRSSPAPSRARTARALVGCALIVCGLAAGAPPGTARAQEADAQAAGARAERSGLPEALVPRVKSALTPTTIGVGEVAKLKIEVDAPANVQITLPEQPFGGLELADRKLSTEPSGDRVRTIYELDLLAFEAGSLQVPALTLRYVGPLGELDEGHTEPHALTVVSPLANEPNAEPKPPSKPVTVVQDDYTLAWIGLGLLAVALVALATLYISRWLKRREKVLPPPPPPRPPWELAFDKLHALARQKDQLLAEHRGEEFVDGVSDALREYLGRRYGFDGLERTTGELLATLERLRPDRLSLSGVSLLLEQCDLVKFARATPEPEQCDDLFNGAMGLVRSTVPSAPMTAPLPARPSLPPSKPPSEKELGT